MCFFFWKRVWVGVRNTVDVFCCDAGAFIHSVAGFFRKESFCALAKSARSCALMAALCSSCDIGCGLGGGVVAGGVMYAEVEE